MTTELSMKQIGQVFQQSAGYGRDDFLSFARAIIQADRAQRQAGQHATALIDDGTLRWNIPTPTSSVPSHLLKGLHLLYTAPQPAPVPDGCEPLAWKWEHIDTDGKQLNCGLSFTRVEPTDNAFWEHRPEHRVETRVTPLYPR